MSAVLAAAGPVIPNFGGGTSSCVRDNHTFCWSWVKSNWNDVFGPRLVQHIELTLIAIAIGFVIAFAAALFAYERAWFETPFTYFSAALYTIPSIALFELLVPITGLTRLTIEIPLVSYTLLILFRNTVAGLRGVPDEVRESARGMGFTRRQTLLQVELPMALPAIIAGVQIAAVTIISLATIAALVVDEGLGVPIFEAIPKGPFTTELIAAAALSIALALVAYALLAGAQRALAPWARTREA